MSHHSVSFNWNKENKPVSKLLSSVRCFENKCQGHIQNPVKHLR